MSSSARPHARFRAWGACLVVGLVLIAVAATLLATRHDPARAKAIPLVNVGRVPTAGQPPRKVTESGQPIPSGSRLRLDRLGVDAPITDVGLDGRVMQVPRDPHVVGWWTAGAKPGSDHGSIVIVGHINYAGVDGALGVLPRAHPNDIVTLQEGRTTLRYRIVAVHSYPKTTGLPADLFSTTGPARLVLITCGGDFDSSSGNYVDNIVGYAEPI